MCGICGFFYKNIYHSFEKMLNKLKYHNWINIYIFWELSLIKELGFEIELLNSKNSTKTMINPIEINNKSFVIPMMSFFLS